MVKESGTIVVGASITRQGFLYQDLDKLVCPTDFMGV